MTHQHVLKQWAELNAMIEAARPTTEKPDAHACMDAIKEMAEGHAAHIAAAKAEHEAKMAARSTDHDHEP